MKEIILTDTEARIANIITTDNGVFVDLEWGGPGDRSVTDFDLEKLGKVVNHGAIQFCSHAAWVILDGECKLKEGDTIPLVESPPSHQP